MRKIWFVLLVGVAGACATAPEGRSLGRGEWRAVDINGHAVPATPTVTLTLGDGRASGSGGCNSFSTSFERQSREGVRFGTIAATRMACEAAVMEQEQRYFSILEAVRGYSFYGDGSLSLIALDGRAIRFRRN